MCRPRFRNPEPDAPDLLAEHIERTQAEWLDNAKSGDPITLNTLIGFDDASAVLDAPAILRAVLNQDFTKASELADELVKRVAATYALEGARP